MNNDALKQEIIHGLAEAVQRGGRSLKSVPGLLARLVDEELWLERDVNGDLVRFQPNEFRAFVESPYPVGLSTTLETLEALSGHEPKVLDFIAAAKRGKRGRPIGSTNTGSRKVNAAGDVVEINHHNMSINPSIHPESPKALLNRLRSAAYDIDPNTGAVIGIKDAEIARLHQKVLNKELSPNAAAKAAGFRPNKVSVNMDNAESAARALLKHMEPDILDELRHLLCEWQVESI